MVGSAKCRLNQRDISTPLFVNEPYFVGRISPSPLLIVVAKHDELIPSEASTAFISAAHADESTQVHRVESGHVRPTQTVCDVRDFLLAYLGTQK